MAATDYAANLTRPHWAGPNADVDIHLEIFQGDNDTAFVYNSFFRSNSGFISVQDRSNQARIDRMNTVTIKGRQSGVALERETIPNDKLVITVDTVTYASTVMDWQDDWTAPDRWADAGRNHGTEHAKLFDQAHIIQLQKSRKWLAPAHLKPAFYDGKEYTAIIPTATADAEADKEKFASNIIAAHAAGIEEMVNRDLGGSLTEFITVVSPRVFGVLLHSKKLINVDYSAGNGNFAARRVGMVNGVRIVESARFPRAAITNHPLGASFNVDADDVACEMVVYHPKMTLVTVEAKPLTTNKWPDDRNFADVLDSFTLYTIGQRRPDTSFAVKLIPQT